MATNSTTKNETTSAKNGAKSAAATTSSTENISNTTEDNKKNQKTAEASTQQFIYLGPNMTRYGLVKAKVYNGGYPTEQTKQLVEKCPLIKTLFVPISKIAETEKAMQNPGTPQYKAKMQLLALRGGE